VETKGKVTPLRDILASNSTCFRLNDLDVSVKTLITFREEQDIVEGVVEGMYVADGFCATVFVTQDYVPVVIHILFSCARHDGSHFVHGGQVVSTTIISWL
jgi:hypothetical protein